MLTDFDLFRKHCRADDFDDETELLRFLLEAAEEAVVKATNRSAAELVEMGGGKFPHRLRIAVYSLGAHWYNQREGVAAVQMHGVPETFEACVKPFKRLCKPEE